MRIPLQPVRFSGPGAAWSHRPMTTLLIPDTADARVEEPTPGCGCCVPPPDTVDKRVAQLQERKERLERRLARLT